MVSGSDAHGTPITVRADAEGVTPFDVYQRYHSTFLELFQQLGITYDLFTSTHTANHFRVSQDIFLALKQNGNLYTDRELQWFAPSAGRFLPDRYVEGTCYICGFTNARSDQCDHCGNLLDPAKLIEPHSKIDGSTPELRETEHFYLDLGKLQPEIAEFSANARLILAAKRCCANLSGRSRQKGCMGDPSPATWIGVSRFPSKAGRANACMFGLRPVIGYLSASIEWAQISGSPEAWESWWQNPDARTYYFIGKDNIPFHAVIWPGQLIGSGTTFGRIDRQPAGYPADAAL